MICEFNKHSIWYCQGSGKVYFDEPDIIYESEIIHTCVPKIPQAKLNTACFNAARTTIGDPLDLFKQILERFEIYA